MIRHEMTGTEAGLSLEQQKVLMLQRFKESSEVVSQWELIESVSRRLPPNVQLSNDGSAALLQILEEWAQSGYIRVTHTGENVDCSLTESGQQFAIETLSASGTALENTESTETELHRRDNPPVKGRLPYNVDEIKVDVMPYSVFQVMRKIMLDEVILNPEFQRNFVWDKTRQSRLIESLLLRVPLPALYVEATRDDKWLVVDGLQRLTTLDRFYNQKTLKLENLQFMPELEGKGWDDLPRKLQVLIEERTKLHLHIIDPGTPTNVKFTIFSRVNTGGMVLTAQEIRHALYQGQATEFLRRLSECAEFQDATDGAINSLRMDDRECILRYLAFRLSDYRQYGEDAEQERFGMDGFLNSTMKKLAEINPSRLNELEAEFRATMGKARSLMGKYTFRKMYSRDGRRSQISKALFEVWSVLLKDYSKQTLLDCQDKILDGFVAMMNQEDRVFEKAISAGTGSRNSVLNRFSAVEHLLQEATQ